MGNLWKLTCLVAALLAGAPALAQAPPPPGNDSARLDRLEEELARTRAELDDLKRAKDSSARAAAGGPTAAAQGEMFQKKYGKDAVPVWNNGFQLLWLDEKAETPGERVVHRFGVSGRVMADGRAYLDNDHPQNDRFFLRRARITASGTLFRHVDFVMEVEMGQFGAGIAEGWVQLAYLKELKLRFGQFKPPFSLERWGSSRYLSFIERAMAKRWSNVDFDVGAMALGEVPVGDNPSFLSWQAAVYDGTGTGVADNNDMKDWGVRVNLKPFAPPKADEKNPVELILGGSYHQGHESNFTPTYRTEAVDGNVDPNGASTDDILRFTGLAAGVTQRGRRRLWGTELRLNFGPLTIQSEYASMDVEDLRRATGAKEDAHTRGLYVDLLFMLTGEPYPHSKRVKPKRNFLEDGGAGAWQVGVRWDHLRVERRKGDSGQIFTRPGSKEANEIVAGINWFLNPMLKVQVNYSRTIFNEAPTYLRDENEDALYARVAVEF